MESRAVRTESPISTQINELPKDAAERYELLRPIPVEIERSGPDSWVAFFGAARLSMTGHSHSNAVEELAATIVDFVETFRDDPDFTDDVDAVLSYIRAR